MQRSPYSSYSPRPINSVNHTDSKRKEPVRFPHEDYSQNQLHYDYRQSDYRESKANYRYPSPERNTYRRDNRRNESIDKYDRSRYGYDGRRDPSQKEIPYSHEKFSSRSDHHYQREISPQGLKRKLDDIKNVHEDFFDPYLNKKQKSSHWGSDRKESLSYIPRENYFDSSSTSSRQMTSTADFHSSKPSEIFSKKRPSAESLQRQSGFKKIRSEKSTTANRPDNGRLRADCERQENLIESLKRSGKTINIKCYTKLLFLFSKTSQYGKAEALYKSLGDKADIVTKTTMLTV
jgi:hypothetical protein